MVPRIFIRLFCLLDGGIWPTPVTAETIIDAIMELEEYNKTH